MKTEALDAAIHEALLTYARAKNLEEQQNGKELLGNPQTDEEEAEGAKIEDAATAAKRDKMLRIARMLVDSNPRQRRKGPVGLYIFCQSGMASVARFLESFQELTEDDLLHMWSTLYYAAWLSDKPLVQRDFFVRASLLHRRLRCPQAKTLFFCSFFRVLIAEWGKLDRHRTNKFLLFCRIFLAEWMHVLRLLKWEETGKQRGSSSVGCGSCAPRVCLQVATKATGFLFKEVLLEGNARGVALHVVDVLTEEFKGMMNCAFPSATVEGRVASALIGDKEREERLCAFSWLFVPFLRCCCFSRDAALVSRIHERSLRCLGPRDVDLNFVAETLFALASDRRVREENRKQLFVSHQRINREAARGLPSGEAGSERRIGSLTPSTFARLMVQRVIPDSLAHQQQRDRPQQHRQRQPQQQLDSLHELVHETPQSRKRQASADDSTSAPEEAQASLMTPNATGSILVNSNTSQTPMGSLSKRAKKRMPMQQQQERQQQQRMDSLRSQVQAVSDAPCGASVQKAVKHKLKVLAADKGQVGAKTSEVLSSASSLRLPIDSSAVKGVCYAAADGNSSCNIGDSGSSVSSSLREENIREEEVSSPASSGGSPSSPADTKGEGWRTPFKAGSSADDLGSQEEGAGAQPARSADSRAAGRASPSEEAPSSSCSSRRRSSRSLEASFVPSSKRVLFNLRKNKVVAFSRFAPSLAVGPASSSPPCKVPPNTSASETAPAPTSEGPPRGILRAAKLPGPPTPEETAAMPPIVRSAGRQPWWDGATAELMAVLRRALQQSSRARREMASAKLKRKKRKDKKVKREGKHKRVPVAPLALNA
ncbi:hypothetical protein Emag_004223 [Eimeria magna]